MSEINKTTLLNKINIKNYDQENTFGEKIKEKNFLTNKLESKKNNFDVVSITRPIYWPEKGYFEENNQINKYFQTYYDK